LSLIRRKVLFISLDRKRKVGNVEGYFHPHAAVSPVICRNRASMVASWCSRDDKCLVRVVVLKFEQPLSLAKGFFFLPKRQKWQNIA